MSTLGDLTVLQLRRALGIKQQIESLQSELEQLEGGQPHRFNSRSGRRKMSAAGRRRIAEAQRARWAKQQAPRSGASKPRRKSSMSSAGRAKIAAAQRRRWARVKAG